MEKKIVGLFLIGIMSLLTWNLHQTWSMKEEIYKLQQGQVILSEQIKKVNNFVKKKFKQKQRQNKKKKKKQDE